MHPILAAAAIALQLTIPGRPPAAPKATCHIKTVSYKFVGAPGTEFRYDGTKYVVPAEGSIELIANKKATEAQFGTNQHLPLDLFPLDDFGTRTINLTATAASNPAPATAPEPTSKGE